MYTLTITKILDRQYMISFISMTCDLVYPAAVDKLNDIPIIIDECYVHPSMVKAELADKAEFTYTLSPLSEDDQRYKDDTMKAKAWFNSLTKEQQDMAYLYINPLNPWRNFDE